jgi:glucose-1-phosphate thymidylyltransferase
MQAVILAAGRGTRMKELTADRPKPMLLLHGRPVLEYILDALPPQVDEVIIVLGYLGHVIQQHFGGQYGGRRILYAEQEAMNGTAGALWAVRDVITGRFLVMNGDDICRAEDTAACAASPDWAMLVQDVEEIGSAGKVVIKDNLVTDVLEKEMHAGGRGIANTANFFLLDERVFNFPLQLRPGSDTEYGLPQTIVQAARDIPIHPIHAGQIIRLTDPEDLPRAEKLLS